MDPYNAFTTTIQRSVVDHEGRGTEGEVTVPAILPRPPRPRLEVGEDAASQTIWCRDVNELNGPIRSLLTPYHPLYRLHSHVISLVVLTCDSRVASRVVLVVQLKSCTKRSMNMILQPNQVQQSFITMRTSFGLFFLYSASNANLCALRISSCHFGGIRSIARPSRHEPASEHTASKSGRRRSFSHGLESSGNRPFTAAKYSRSLTLSYTLALVLLPSPLW